MKKSTSKENISKDEGDEPIPEKYKRLEPKLPTSEELIKKSMLVLRRGYITINDLVCILALDESYKKSLLYAHWDELQISKRKNFPEDVSSPEKRIGVWFTILERWTSKSIGGNKSGLKPIAGLTGYKFITDEDKFIEDKDDPDYVKLGELKLYLDNIKFPLPSLLFPEDKQQKVIMITVPDGKMTEKKSHKNFFIREGDFWLIGYEGKESGPIKHVDGLLYISFLLKNFGMSISCQKLVQSVSGKTSEITMSESDANKQGLKTGFKKQSIITSKEKILFQKKYDELQRELECADMERLEEIKEQMSKLEPYLKLKKRNFADPSDKKAQSNVNKRLEKAYEVLNKANMRELQIFLQDNIKNDDAYGLRYVGSIKWEIVYK